MSKEENNDFDFYEDAEEGKISEIRGITDNVTNYTYTDLSYPCIVLDDGFKCPMHRMLVISNMVKSNTPDKDISLYFTKGYDMYKVGMLSGTQVKPLLDILDISKLKAYYDKGVELTGDMVYTLCC